MVIKLLRVCLFKIVRGLGIGSLKHFDKHLVCNSSVIDGYEIPTLSGIRDPYQ
jgi:hypothetical protein